MMPANDIAVVEVAIILSGVLPASVDVKEVVEDPGEVEQAVTCIDSTPALNQISRLYSITESLYSSHDSSASQLPAPR
jgi:hypothetical protein